MIFTYTVYTALFISFAGLVFHIWGFFKKKDYFTADRQSKLDLKQFFFNTFFQTRLFKANRTRWFAHFLVCLPFVFLLCFHAMDDLISFYLFDTYQPTVDPFQFLRNFLGFLVLLGCLGFFLRRILKTRRPARQPEGQPKSSTGLFAVVVVFGIILSGFCLESFKIISEDVFMDMVEEYSDIDEDNGLEDLRAFWTDSQYVRFKDTPAITTQLLEDGQILNEEYCASCHSDIGSAFVSKVMAKGVFPAGNLLNRIRADKIFYVIHTFLAFLLLASLPFSRLFHVVMIPFSSTKRANDHDRIAGKSAFNPATLYACTQCGLCSPNCSVYPNFLVSGNINILPHAKVESAKKMLTGKLENPKLSHLLFTGNQACTSCFNCTGICPSGIDLTGLWQAMDKKFIQMGLLDTYTIIKNKPLENWSKTSKYFKRPDRLSTGLADQTEAFESCIQCTICSNVCPIVEHDAVQNDYTPQQIMNLLRLGEKHLATGTRMVANCLTCYSCQEICPQGIKVTDILLELRTTAAQTARNCHDKTTTKD
ncbi:MAG: 4Fe-4S dicluster domain-containing protein [Desulfobacteraceae bacterium]|nr:4Fe-4S dicluster domain-containing protein [Desulfobacteraceae bacterium]